MLVTPTRTLCLCLTISAALAVPVGAEELSPVGRWTTVDDSSGKPKSVVAIREEGGVLFGKVESVVAEPGEDPNPKCDKCDGARKNQPVIGMEIMWGLRQDGSEWSGGTILDPNNGKTYKCYIEPIEGGAKLKVRGYIGFALIGRTQYWLRAP